MSSARRASAIGRWLALSRADRGLRREAWWELLRASTRLRLAPRSLLAETAKRASPAAPRADRLAAPEPSALADAVASAAAHHLWTMTCLPRAFALLRMLERRGVPARLRIGVRKESAALAAHAWVEADGVALGEPEDVEKRFAPLLGVEEERERGV